MNLLSELDLLLDFAEEESSVGTIGGMISHSLQYKKAFRDISSALMSYETTLKALEIIKEKRVDISWFYYSDGIDKYNSTIEDSRRYITEEEYNLLKEVLL